MKTLVVLILVSLNVGLAQEVLFRGNINVKPKEVQFISGIEKDGTILLNVNKGEGVNEFYLIDNRGQVIQVYDIGYNSGKVYHIIHISAVDDNFFLYTYRESLHTSPNGVQQNINYFQYLKFAKDGSKRPELTNLTGMSPYDRYLVSIARSDTVFIVGVNDRAYTTSVTIVPPNHQITRKEFNLGDRKTFQRFIRADYFPVKNLPENSFETFLHKNKVYLKDNSVIFISDDDQGPVSRTPGSSQAPLNRNTIFITTLDLKTTKAKVDELRLNYSIKADHNSYLFGDELFTVGATREDYSMSVHSFPSLIEKRKYSQKEIERSIDWSKLINSNNETGTPTALKENFQKFMKTGVPIIGLQQSDTLALVFGLFMHKSTEENRVGLGNDIDRVLNSYGLISNTTRYPSYRPAGTGTGSTLPGSTTVLVPMQLPLYFLPSASRPLSEKRIYGKITIDKTDLSLGKSMRPETIYDKLELQTERWREKNKDLEIFSFENNDFIFLAYITAKNKEGDHYVIIEKYKR